ncbi:uncharacterized protein BXIN_0073 [Babesia sp. Xinjiang]|uniref:uncharacterized protein n=1 Tax=Babesia sp. Xinjiang TaxID=462227 RepID=UPI000A21EC9D|nr:uncharacterized protein BXIN_0073 [Babesia sp. Xinjiang]ORM39688.1 hypothetical protein BXIN_0073 [Babesia sp. Xinjiang]
MAVATFMSGNVLGSDLPEEVELPEHQETVPETHQDVEEQGSQEAEPEVPQQVEVEDPKPTRGNLSGSNNASGKKRSWWQKLFGNCKVYSRNELTLNPNTKPHADPSSPGYGKWYTEYDVCGEEDAEKAQAVRDKLREMLPPLYTLRGGTYRLLHMKSSSIDSIVYDDYLVPFFSRYKAITDDIYIQDYQRGNTRIFSISSSFVIGTTGVRTVNYKIIGRRCVIVGIKSKSAFLSGPISLRLDINSAELHPFIIPHATFTGDQTMKWVVITREHRSTDRSNKIHKLRFSGESLVLSPIIIVDKETNGPGYPATSISGLIDKFAETSVTGDFNLWIKYRKRGLPHAIKIPPIENGIFKPCNIIQHHYTFCKSKHFQPIERTTVIIDISKTEVNVAELIVLANLKRGDWLYTQYTISPVRDQLFLFVRVINSVTGSELYQVEDSTFITHVEVFDNVTYGWQYVVVNYERSLGKGIKGFQKVYVRQNGERGVIYIDLSNFWPDSYIQMLYNINTFAPNPCDQDLNNLIMDAFSASPNTGEIV